MSTFHKNYDTWKETDAALRAINRLFSMSHDSEPDKKDKEARRLWEEELVEVRRWAHSVGQRRFDLVNKELK